MNSQVDAHPGLDVPDYLGHLVADTERFALVLERGPRDAPVAACPGWDVARLARHLGAVHRWARHAVVTGAPPDSDPSIPADDDQLADWLRAGAADLVSALEHADPSAPTWHPFPVERVTRVWPRRQAIETVLHRWDAEAAAGWPATIDTVLASDGIDEYFEVALPRLMAREGVTLPAGSFHLHCTDTAGEWLVRTADDGSLVVRREHAKGDAALRGPAEPMLLRLWSRTSERAGELDVVGDHTVAGDWLSLPGM